MIIGNALVMLDVLRGMPVVDQVARVYWSYSWMPLKRCFAASVPMECRPHPLVIQRSQQSLSERIEITA